MRRLAVLGSLLFTVCAWIAASQVWASATLVDTEENLVVTGLDAYPQIAIILLTGLLLLWLGKYLNSVFTKFITSSVLVLLIATGSPIWFDSASGSLSILSAQIAKKSGISDWLGQSALISTSSYNHLAADLFVIALVGWFVTGIIFVWARRPGQVKQDFTTRIDNLPSW